MLNPSPFGRGVGVGDAGPAKYAVRRAAPSHVVIPAKAGIQASVNYGGG